MISCLLVVDEFGNSAGPRVKRTIDAVEARRVGGMDE